MAFPRPCGCNKSRTRRWHHAACAVVVRRGVEIELRTSQAGRPAPPGHRKLPQAKGVQHRKEGLMSECLHSANYTTAESLRPRIHKHSLGHLCLSHPSSPTCSTKAPRSRNNSWEPCRLGTHLPRSAKFSASIVAACCRFVAARR